MKTGGIRRVALMLLPFMFAAQTAAQKSGVKTRGGSSWGAAPVYTPKRTRYKGYMRENKRCNFNKNK